MLETQILYMFYETFRFSVIRENIVVQYSSILAYTDVERGPAYRAVCRNFEPPCKIYKYITYTRGHVFR